MKKLFFHSKSSPATTGIALLILRVFFGLGMVVWHGWGKLINFSSEMESFYNLFGIGSVASLTGAVFAEVVCAALVSIGLFTRAALIPLIFTMAIAAFVVKAGAPFADRELALLFLGAYVALFLTGPGKFSIDHKL